MDNASRPSNVTKIAVDGFRSLRDFHVELHAGLNVLVGPNGSGKSNFIDFLEFLSTFIRSGAPLATSRAGGVARVFCQENLRRKSPALKISIRGITQVSSKRHRVPKDSYLKYEYKLELRFSKLSSTIYVREEQLKLGRLRRTAEKASRDVRFLGHMRLLRQQYNSDNAPLWYCSEEFYSDSVFNPLSLRSRTAILRQPQTRAHIERALSSIEGNTIDIDRSFLSEFPRSLFPAIEAVRSAITRGSSFNISPAKARDPDDIARPPFIESDGSGLSATLFALQALRSGKPNRIMYFEENVDKDTLDEIVNWTKLVYPHFNDIYVQSDLHSGKYISFLTIKVPVGLRIPFHSISDGTVKWLALVTLILTSGGAYAIEEPENFLYPKMQQFLIGLIRDVFSSEEFAEYFVLSTHSETIVSECKTSEIIIFEYKNGCTNARRIEDGSAVAEEINKTGFGLGYYFAHNALP